MGPGLVQMCKTGLATGADSAGVGRLGVGELRELGDRGGRLQSQHSGERPNHPPPISH